MAGRTDEVLGDCWGLELAEVLVTTCWEALGRLVFESLAFDEGWKKSVALEDKVSTRGVAEDDRRGRIVGGCKSAKGVERQ